MIGKSAEPGFLAADDPLGAALARRIAEMRSTLAAMKPSTVADRLQALRRRFPDVPLQERVRALQGPRS